MANKTTETVEEFLARGGKINVIPSAIEETKHQVLKKTNNGVATLLTMEEAELFYSESRKKNKSKKMSNIDISSLPKELREKFIDRIIEEERDVE